MKNGENGIGEGHDEIPSIDVEVKADHEADAPVTNGLEEHVVTTTQAVSSE